MVNFYLSLSTMLVFLGYGYGFWQNSLLSGDKNTAMIGYLAKPAPTPASGRENDHTNKKDNPSGNLPGR